MLASMNAFDSCENLLTVDTHNGLRKIGAYAFRWCGSLRRINLKYAVEINEEAFYGSSNLESVEFGDRLETIGNSAFCGCESLTHVKLPSIITIGACAFYECHRLIDVELSDRLETIGASAFRNCEHLQRIAIPLKRDLFAFSACWQTYNQFDDCRQLTTVDLVGGIGKIVASLHMQSWRTEMIAEIDRIDQDLPGTRATGKTTAIILWMDSVMDNLDRYKSDHYRYVREGITLLELALWRAKLCEKVEYTEEGKTTKAKVDTESYRMNKRITCGADMVIKNVLPFLQLE